MKTMSIKEFSQKNSVILFYTTIILIIAVIVLCFTPGIKGSKRMGPGNFQGNNQPGMMQNNNVNIPD